MRIHPLASVDPTARLGDDIQVGPYCMVEANVTIGAACILESHVVVKEGTTLGTDNHVFEGAVLGGLPQHIHTPENPGRLVIGHGNTLRENVTIHRAMQAGQATVVGDHNLVMIGAHVAHDCRLGQHVILTNNTMLAGHVTVEDRAYLSGAVGVHQFCRIGTLAMVGGQAHVNRDVPPYVTVDGVSGLVVGLNTVGLKRAGFQRHEMQQLKEAYRVIYRSGLSWAEVLKRLKSEYSTPPAAELHRFLSTTNRGITPGRRLPPGATIKLRHGTAAEDAAPVQAKAVRAKAG